MTGTLARVGVSVHDSALTGEPARRRAILSRARDAGLDHFCVGDHVSFHDGAGFDGLICASSVLSSVDDLPVIVGVYLLGLRHPLVAARQLASIAQFAPGRLVLGVGVGGEDRAEISNSGVDPATRGRRLDESLLLLGALASGEPVDYRGEFFTLKAARILPAPSPRIPVVIGGKGEVAVRRAARYGDGWLGMFCSARRFAQTRQEIAAAAAGLGRPVPSWYGINVWCGLDADERRARHLLARELESLYRLPHERFERLAPAGPPALVAEWLAPYLAAGASHLTVIPAAASAEAGIDYAAEVRTLLQAAQPTAQSTAPATAADVAADVAGSGAAS